MSPTIVFIDEIDAVGSKRYGAFMNYITNNVASCCKLKSASKF